MYSFPSGNLVGSSRLELPTSRLSGARSNHLSYEPLFRSLTFGVQPPPTAQVRSHFGGDEGNRTPDPLLAKQVLSQLSYTPASGFLPSGSHRSPLPGAPVPPLGH